MAIVGVIITVAPLYYSNHLANNLAEREKTHTELLVRTLEEMVANVDLDIDVGLALRSERATGRQNSGGDEPAAGAGYLGYVRHCAWGRGRTKSGEQVTGWLPDGRVKSTRRTG